MKQIESEHLLLRQWVEEDKEPFYRMNSRPEVMKMISKPFSREESDETFYRVQKMIDSSGWGPFAVELRQSKKLIGMVGIKESIVPNSGDSCIEILWRLDSLYWGNGYATEAAIAVSEYAFRELKINELLAFTAKINTSSIAVMERIGMSRDSEGDFDHYKVEVGNPLRPHVLYRLHSEAVNY